MSQSEEKNLQEPQHDSLDITEYINPFPGLRPFSIEESHLFFGREGQSDEVRLKLSENRFVSILGSSGSGKSSLMYCGLIPSLYGGFMTEAGSHWKIVVTRPGGGPIDNLAESLHLQDKEFASLSEEDKLIRKTITSTLLRSSSLGLVEVIKQMNFGENQNILILIDQFEELFRYQKVESAISDQDESSAFVNLILESVNQFELPIYIAITMRSDFIGECAQYPDLTQMINDSHYLIPQMTRDQKRLAIEGPVAVGGGEIAPRLTQQLLNDVGESPDQLPILQHALMRAWSYWTENKKDDEPIDLRHYNAIGTLSEALSLHANEAFDSLTKRQQEICETAFKALIERGSENQGIRRPTKLATIAAIAGVSEDEVIEIIEKFREPGRSLLMPPFGVYIDSETVIDISHESLMRIWTRLKSWLDEEAKSADMYLKLSEAAERYQEGKAGLWQMPDLQLALNWREENRPTLVWGQRYHPAFERVMVFLETSEKAYQTEQRNKELLQKRQVRRMRLTVAFLALAMIVSIFFVVFANIQTELANELRDDAEKSALKAQNEASNAREAEAQAELEKENALMAKSEADREKRRAEEAAARAEEARKQADAALIQAKRSEEIATRNATLATQRENQAKLAQEEADKNADQANKLRYQLLATSMAVKSLNINNDNELRGLVALQAFDFFNKYKEEGKDYNGDLYAGVYNAYARLSEEKRGDSIIRFNQYWGHNDAVRSVVHSKNGENMYSAGSDGLILKWNLDTKNYEVIFKHDDIQRVIGISPNEKYLVIGTENNQIMIYNQSEKKSEPFFVKGHEGGTIFDVVFLPNESGFISSGEDGRLLISNFKTTREILKVKSPVRKIDISPDGNMLVCGAWNGEVYLVDLSNNDYNTTKIWIKDAQPVEAVTFNATGDIVAFGNYTGNIILWDLKEKKQYGPTLTGFSSAITDVEFSADSRLLAASSRDKTVRTWDLNNIYDLPTVLDDHKGWVLDISFHPQVEHIVTACSDGLLRKFPIKLDGMASEIPGYITSGNMSDTEWFQYVDEDIAYQAIIDELPRRQGR